MTRDRGRGREVASFRGGQVTLGFFASKRSTAAGDVEDHRFGGATVIGSIGWARESSRPVVQPPWRPIAARAKSGDHPVNTTNGAIEKALQDSIASCSGIDEQTTSDSDQTLADVDQTMSDSDQTSADRDQSAADSDQAASHRDFGSGVNARAYELSR